MNSVLVSAAREFQYLVWPALAVVFSLGLLATLAPGQFAVIASRGGRWIDTERVLAFLDRNIDVDQHVLRYSRLFGILVALASAWLAYVYWAHFLN